MQFCRTIPARFDEFGTRIAKRRLFGLRNAQKTRHFRPKQGRTAGQRGAGSAKVVPHGTPIRSETTMTTMSELSIGADPRAWERVGLAVDGASARVGAITLRLSADAADGTGVAAWGLADLPEQSRGITSIDGLPTFAAEAATTPAESNPMGALRVELVSVFTTSIERTVAAIEQATGIGLRALRESERYRVGFVRLGEALAEVGQSSRATGDAASFGGMILVVDDLPGLCDRLGPDVISEPRIAVQYGRHIATFRPATELGAPIAVMTVPPVNAPTEDELRDWEANRLAVMQAKQRSA
jgi:hypothetical protein